MLLLVSDANILIDVEEGGLLDPMFRLGCRFIIPDILYEEELSARHSHFLERGLTPKSLTPESMLAVMKMAQTYRHPSRNDLFALSLAKQEECSLLTGDKALRTAAETEGVPVLGTIWLVEELVREKKISVDIAKAAYQKMRQAGSRLPWKRAADGLDKLNQ